MNTEITEKIDTILDQISNIEENLQGLGFEDYRNDRRKKIAVVQSFETIIEYVNSFTEDEKKQVPSVDWEVFLTLRSKFLNAEIGLNDEQVWKAAKNQLKKLKLALKF